MKMRLFISIVILMVAKVSYAGTGFSGSGTYVYDDNQYLVPQYHKEFSIQQSLVWRCGNADSAGNCTQKIYYTSVDLNYKSLENKQVLVDASRIGIWVDDDGNKYLPGELDSKTESEVDLVGPKAVFVKDYYSNGQLRRAVGLFLQADGSIQSVEQLFMDDDPNSYFEVREKYTKK